MRQERLPVNPLTGVIPENSQIIINLPVSVPLMNHIHFSNHSGFSVGVVGGWMDNGYLPTVKVGRYQVINMVLLAENLKQGFVL